MVTSAAIAVVNVEPIGDYLFERLAGRFPVGQILRNSDIKGIIILGGTFNGRDAPGDRFEAGVRLAKQFTGAEVVVSGPGQHNPEDGPRAALIADGIASDRITIESYSLNTFENALNSAALLRPEASTRWILITSAYHMPRAMGAFRKAGFAVAAYPVDDDHFDDRAQAHIAFRETFGLIYYWFTARSSSLFPSP